VYAFIKGRLDSISRDYVIVEAGGVGYRIFTSMKTIEALGSEGKEVKLYTYLQSRDDTLILYGFHSLEELAIFQLLISVSGVGPKAAISLLSVHSPSELSLAIISGNHRLLMEAPGIGVKTAQRVVLELKDKLMKQDIALSEDIKGSVPAKDSIALEAVSALMALGYDQQEAAKMVQLAYKEGMGVEDVLKEALKMSYNG